MNRFRRFCVISCSAMLFIRMAGCRLWRELLLKASLQVRRFDVVCRVAPPPALYKAGVFTLQAWCAVDYGIVSSLRIHETQTKYVGDASCE